MGREAPRAAEDLAQVVALAEEHLVAPSLWLALRDLEGLDPGLERRLRAHYAVNVVNTSRAFSQLRECVDALNRKGVAPVVLKGALGLLEDPLPTQG
ncbi:MAG: nucleotidyltransferase family protein, partial [Acidimicrobiales bacterium]